MTITLITQNYDLSPKHKTEPMASIPSNIQDLDEKKARHLLVKAFIKCIKDEDWYQAEKNYRKFSEEDKKIIEQFIFERSLKIRPSSTPVDIESARKRIDITFSILNGRDPDDEEIAFDFLGSLFIPVVYQHLIETFEQEKTESISKVADKVVATSRKLFTSPNFPRRDNRLSDYIALQHPSDPKAEYIAQVNHINDVLNVFTIESNNFLQKQPKMNTFLIKLYIAQMVNECCFVNCEEMADYGFYVLHKDKQVKRIERATIKNGDHEIDIINRRRKSDRNNMMTWGPHCKVLDSWTNGKNVFPAYDIPIHLTDYKGLDAEMNPILKPFDPYSQSIKLSASDIYSANDLEAMFIDFRKYKA
ncbi:MAG TPA: hypothetical protein VLE96_00025, partial [Chlamydiales bacterium]|nr:hypothetical protein [Chlamydiales bacterium]